MICVDNITCKELGLKFFRGSRVRIKEEYTSGLPNGLPSWFPTNGRVGSFKYSVHGEFLYGFKEKGKCKMFLPENVLEFDTQSK